ncbi:MAG TPA: SMC-Scp complex subunit ScpB [Methanosarcinaceae archaeon]|nr:SMC-Scp complex subunit ScpB [Methanosarcinaceae archaeon]
MIDKETIEASLFAAGRALDVLTLSKIINKPKKRVDPIVQSLIREYKGRECGLEIIDLGDRYVMQVKPQYTDLVRPLAPKEVGAPMLRTLSMIAYHQPVIQSDLVDMRGNAAYDHIRELKERGFIAAVAHGRTKLLRTTPMFADYFELGSNDPESIKKKIVDLSRQQSGQSGLDRWLGRKVVAVTPMYESLMEMCGIDEYRVISAYDPTEEEIDKLADVYKMVISKGYAERVRKNYDGEIIEVSSTTFNDLIEAIGALEGVCDKSKAQECIEHLKELKEKYASKALVISKKVQPATDMIARIVNDLRIGVSANGVLIAPDYETSSEGVEVGKDADILVPTHKNLKADLIGRVCQKYDSIIDGLKELEN